MRIHSVLGRVLLSLFALWLVLPISSVFAQEKAYVYDRIDVVVNVHEDGLLDVSETMTFDYTGGPFRSAVREIPFEKLDDIRNMTVREGEQTYTEATDGEAPGTYIVTRENDMVWVKWYYEPTSDATRTFTVGYEVEGSIRVEGATDELWWVAIFPERDVPVEQSSIIVNLPEGVDLDQVQVDLPAADGRVSTEGRSVSVVRDEPLPGGMALDVQVQVPSALIDAPEPAWQRNPTSRSSRNEGVVPYVPSERSNTGTDSGSTGRLFFWGIILVALFILGQVFGNNSSSSSRYYDSSRSSSSSSWDNDHRSWGGSDSGSSWGSGSSSDRGSGGGRGGAD
ncbi:MAG: DUF2207 domain-containing protein [Chloroflexota bacterium]